MRPECLATYIAMSAAGVQLHADVLGDPGHDVLGDELGGLAIRVRQQDRELVTAEPCDEVGGAQPLPEHPGEVDQELVAGSVTP